MDEKKVIIEGYQPVARLHDGNQPVASVQNGKEADTFVSSSAAMVNITPPKGGTGEVSKE